MNRYSLLLVLTFSFNLVQGQELKSKVDAYVSSYVNCGDFSGCILISSKDSIIYEDCFGMADYAFIIPNDDQTKFKIGSVSKQFTAAAILHLADEGVLNIDDTIESYFPDQPDVRDITIEQLLTHTSGVTDIYNVPDFNKLSCRKIDLNELVEMVLQEELQFEPGSQYQYSNGAYALLAFIIEQESESTYQEFLSEKIFLPLGMQSSGHSKGNEVVSNLAQGYDPMGYSSVKNTDYLDPELLKGSGSLYSTTNDMLKWIHSIKAKTLLSDSSYKKLLHDYGHSYGLGISVYESFDNTVFGHDGRVNGYIADYLHYQEADISIIILGNLQTGIADFLRRDIAAIVFEKEYKSRSNTSLAAKDQDSTPSDILGTYAFGPNFKVYVEFRDGSIQARANEGSYSELVLLEDGRYFSRTLYSYIDFEEEDDGTTTKMLWTNNDGNTFTGTKEQNY